MELLLLFYTILSILLPESMQDTANMQKPLPDWIPVVDGDWWQIASEDFDAGPWTNKPLPGETVERGHQEVSDFTIYQAADGSWQLISAVRQTRFPGKKHLLLRWESQSLQEPDWTEKGVFWTTATTPEAGYAPGIIFAPHCVRHNGRFYIFHNSGGTALVLSSEDGINFEQARDYRRNHVFFPTGEAGRDLMLFDNRQRDGLWYAYYTTMDRERPELANRHWHDLHARLATQLEGPWSPQFVVGMGTPDRPSTHPDARANFVTSESPCPISRGILLQTGTESLGGFTHAPVLSVCPHCLKTESGMPLPGRLVVWTGSGNSRT